MGYDAGRTRKSEVLFFTAGPRNGVLWDLSVTNVLRHRRLARRSGEHEVEAARPRSAPKARGAEKPVGLFWDLARAVTRAGDVVADLFVGRGRWIQRFLEEGRHVLAVDRDPRWIGAVASDFAQTQLAGG